MLLPGQFRFFIILVLSPILTLFYWFVFVPVLIPFNLFRLLLFIVVRYRDPDVCKIVDRFSHIMSRDYADWDSRPSQCITTIFKLTGNMTIEEARQLVFHRVVHKKATGANSLLEYPELQQYYTKRFGYLFYKRDRNFDIKNHVNIYCDNELLPHPETDTVDESKLMRIWESLMTRPFTKKQSPWEVLLIPRYETNPNETEGWSFENPVEECHGHCILIFRTHHGFCDGVSIHKLLLTLTDNGLTVLKDIVAFQKAPVWMDLFLNLSGFFCGPTAFIKRFSKGLDTYNPIHIPLRKLTGKHRIVKTTLDLDTIKKIARLHHNVSFHSVLIAGLTGGIRNYLLANGHSILYSPIRMGIPIPKLGHSGKLRNEFYLSMVDLPVEKKSPTQRLFACEQRLSSLKGESLMALLVLSCKLLGGLPFQLFRLLTSKSAVTVMYSEIKAPSIPLSFNVGKHEVMELLFSIGLGTDDMGVAFNSISVKGKIHLMLTIDQGICKTIGNAEKLLNFIEKELEDLHHQS